MLFAFLFVKSHIQSSPSVQFICRLDCPKWHQLREKGAKITSRVDFTINKLIEWGWLNMGFGKSGFSFIINWQFALSPLHFSLIISSIFPNLRDFVKMPLAKSNRIDISPMGLPGGRVGLCRAGSGGAGLGRAVYRFCTIYSSTLRVLHLHVYLLLPLLRWTKIKE